MDKLISNDDYAHVLSPEYPQAVDDFELFRRQHEKFWSFGLMVLCLASLSGCESITRAIRGDDYVNAK